MRSSSSEGVAKAAMSAVVASLKPPQTSRPPWETIEWTRADYRRHGRTTTTRRRRVSPPHPGAVDVRGRGLFALDQKREDCVSFVHTLTASMRTRDFPLVHAPSRSASSSMTAALRRLSSCLRDDRQWKAAGSIDQEHMERYGAGQRWLRDRAGARASKPALGGRKRPHMGPVAAWRAPVQLQSAQTSC